MRSYDTSASNISRGITDPTRALALCVLQLAITDQDRRFVLAESDELYDVRQFWLDVAGISEDLWVSRVTRAHRPREWAAA